MGKKKTTKKKTNAWTRFQKGKMGPYMEKYGSHKEAMKHLSKEYAEEKAKKNGTSRSRTKSGKFRKKRSDAGKKKPKSKKAKQTKWMSTGKHVNKGKKKSGGYGFMLTSEHGRKGGKK